jgi:hypothetical protein
MLRPARINQEATVSSDALSDWQPIILGSWADSQQMVS